MLRALKRTRGSSSDSRARTKSAAIGGVAALAAVSIVGAGMAIASATNGGGGGQDGTGHGGVADRDDIYIYDDAVGSAAGNPGQGWGDASIDAFMNNFPGAVGLPAGWNHSYNKDRVRTDFYATCQRALQRATARAKNPATAKSRVVGVHAATSNENGGYTLWGTDKKKLRAHWANGKMDAINKGLAHYSESQKAQFVELANKFYDEGFADLSTDPKVGARLICIAMNSEEPPGILKQPPQPPVKTITEHIHASQMVNTTTISTGTGTGGNALVIKDTIFPNGEKYKISNAVVKDGDNDISSKFDIKITGQDDPAIVATWKGGALPNGHTFKLIFDVTVDRNGVEAQKGRVEDEGKVKWDDRPEVATEKKTFDTWSPRPNKSWISYRDGKWQAVTDKDWTNTTGADDNFFLDGDDVGSVVNGIVHKDLAQAPTAFTLLDDYAKAAPMLDNSKTLAGAKVYAIDAESASGDSSANTSASDVPSVDDAINKGTDVTSQFTLTAPTATSVKAEAKPELLESLKQMAQSKQFVLFLPFKVSVKAQDWLTTFGKKQGEELSTCTSKPSGSDSGSDTTMLNTGSETINNDTRVTNTPKICVWIPPVKKEVKGARTENSTDTDLSNKSLTNGQKVEYRIKTTPHVPGKLNEPIKLIKFTDTYNEMFVPEKNTLDLYYHTGDAEPSIVSRNDWTVDWLDNEQKFVVTMSKAWVAKNAANGSAPTIEVRLSGQFKEAKPKANGEAYNTTDLLNTVEMELSGRGYRGDNPPPNPPSSLVPKKSVTASKTSSISVNGKKAYMGDTVFYRVTLDATPSTPLAYKAMRAGIVDDYDDQYLDVKAADISVLDQNGSDVTAKFNVQVKDGKAYVFAKTVDTVLEQSGGKILKGDPQPTDLAKYMTQKIDPTMQPAIDQTLIGQDYTVVIPATVKKVVDGYDVKNIATEIFNDDRMNTNIVHNPLITIDPKKDVIVDVVDQKSYNTKAIEHHKTFLYKLMSTKIEGKRVQKDVTDWTITDQLDTKHDRFTGQWAVYANTDFTVNDKTIKKGDRMDGTNFDERVTEQPMFELTHKDGFITLKSTDWANKNVFSKQGENDMQWYGYVQVERTSPTEKVENTLKETFNHSKANSNTVWTYTPTNKPALKLIKFDKNSGDVKGDRNTAKDALAVKSSNEKVRVVYRVFNTGNVPLAKLNLTDKVTVGKAKVVDWQYPSNWKSLVLYPGEHVDIEASVTGGVGAHENIGTVTGYPVKPCEDSIDDPFRKDAELKTKEAINIRIQSLTEQLRTVKDGAKKADIEKRLADLKDRASKLAKDASDAVKKVTDSVKDEDKQHNANAENTGRTVVKYVEPLGKITITYDKAGKIIRMLDNEGKEMDISGLGGSTTSQVNETAGTPVEAESGANVKVCTESTMLKASDPWHAKFAAPATHLPQLAKTGSIATLVAGLAILLGGAGSAAVMTSRRRKLMK